MLITLVVVGLCLGSFVNAFVWRHYEVERLNEDLADAKDKKLKNKDRQALVQRRKKLSIVKGRSMCTHCGHELAAKDLVPVLSYVWLRGKCRYCRARIQDSPLSELLTPIVFVVSFFFWPVALQGSQWIVFGFWLIFVVGFVALTLYDRRWFLLPHSIVLPLIGLAIIRVVVLAVLGPNSLSIIVQAVIGAAIIGGLFYLLYWISKEQWIGGGDVTLGILLGLLVGGPASAVLLIFVASLLGTLVALPLMAFGKAGRNTRLPFGPFLMLAGVIVTLFGASIIDWYIQHFLTI